MRVLCLITILEIISFSIAAQTILVQPYLQDAEPNSIKVMWESDGGINHLVNWGTDAVNLNQSVSASSATSEGTHLIHEAIISGLTANTAYHYQVISDSESSGVFKFYTPPLKSSNQSFNLIAMSDMQKDGSNPNKFQEIVNDGVLPYVAQEYGVDLPANLGFVMIPGDLVVTGTSYGQWKNDFFDPAHPLFAQVPIYPVLGNHENNSAYYFQYFELPDNGTPGYEEHWWYKDYSNVRIIGLNSNSGYRIPTQLDWLAGVLDAACTDEDIDFVFAQLHHPHKSELWTPGELDYTGDVIQLLENFTNTCSKQSIHFFGHTHGYSRGQSRDHEHLWVNVASGGGAIDYWGAFPNADYEEFSKSIDEYGFVAVNVEAGANPQFTLKRVSRGDESTPLNNVEQDVITLKANDNPAQIPTPIFPNGVMVNPDCITLEASSFSDSGDSHQASHWQVANACNDFSNPVFDSWKQHENWYSEVNTQAGDLLTDEEVLGLSENSSYCWRVRYRDSHLKWSEWSTQASFTTGISEFTSNLLANPGGENAVTNWTIATGIIESLASGECGGIAPYSGSKYLAVGGLCDGNETNYSEVFQLIDVSGNALDIDAGEVEVSFGGFLSNYNGNDLPTMNLEYQDENDTLLGSSTLLAGATSTWSEYSAMEAVPISTRTIKVILTGTKNAGTDNDSYFDDLQVRLDLTPGNSCSTSLPVELRRINVHCTAGKTALHWEVEAEKAISAYQVEQSVDGVAWELVATQTPLEEGQSKKQYVYQREEVVHSKTVYYRLKIIELDESYHYSPIVSANCIDLSPFINIFPNPVREDHFKIYLDNPSPSLTSIKVANLLGQEIYKNELRLNTGEHQIAIDNLHWSPGLYTISIHTKDWQWSGKLLRE